MTYDLTMEENINVHINITFGHTRIIDIINNFQVRGTYGTYMEHKLNMTNVHYFLSQAVVKLHTLYIVIYDVFFSFLWSMKFHPNIFFDRCRKEKKNVSKNRSQNIEVNYFFARQTKNVNMFKNMAFEKT